MQYSEETGVKFGQQIRLKAQKLVDDFRQGHGFIRQLDQWFVPMADYLEWLQIHESMGTQKSEIVQDLVFWVNELLRAREIEDEVRIADILEYEVIPRLSPSITPHRE